MAYRGSMTPFGGGLGSLFGLRREIDRVFEDAYGGNTTRAGWTPSANVREGKDSVLLEMELPGISPDEVDISIENDMLTVRGEKREERQEGEEEGRYFLVERSYGTFSRSFSLPPGVDADQVSAKFDNGLLTIRIPQGALPQPRRIQIEAGRDAVSSGGEGTRRSQARSEGRTRNGGESKEQRVAAGAQEAR